MFGVDAGLCEMSSVFSSESLLQAAVQQKDSSNKLSTGEYNNKKLFPEIIRDKTFYCLNTVAGTIGVHIIIYSLNR
jgi:hypothetical protein